MAYNAGDDITRYFHGYDILFMKKHQPIHLNTEPWTRVYYLHKGMATIRRIHEDGTEELLRFAGDQSFLGIPNLYTVSENLTLQDTLIYACTDCILYTFPMEQFRELTHQHPEILEHLILSLSMESRDFRKKMDDISHKRTLQALAGLLWDIHQETLEGLEIPGCVTNIDLATYLKIHPVTTSKMMAMLVDMGILIKQDKRFYIIDAEKMVALSENRLT